MTKKQFISIFSLLTIVSIISIYFGFIEPSVSRQKCSDYAMRLSIQSFPDSFEDTGEQFPPKKLIAESSQDARANYDFFYNFCVNKRGVVGQ